MKEIEIGMPARSLAGHDSGKLYIIIRQDGEYVWLADGKCRTLEHPKKKKKKHIQAAYHIPEPLAAILENRRTLCNEHIIQAIQSESRERREDKYVESRCN